MHVGDLRHDRRRENALQFGPSIDQPAQIRRDFGRVLPKDIAKPLADLIADGAGVGTVKSCHHSSPIGSGVNHEPGPSQDP